MNNKVRLQKGVTIFEIVIIVASVILVEILIIGGYIGIKELIAHQHDIQRMNDVEIISAALRTYYLRNGWMPTNYTPGSGYCQNQPNFLRELIDQNILSSIPIDPQYPNKKYCYYDYGSDSEYGAYVVSTMETMKNPAGHCAWKGANNWCMPNSNSFCKCNMYSPPGYSEPIQYPE